MSTSAAKIKLQEIVRRYIQSQHPNGCFTTLHDYLNWLEKSIHIEISVSGNASFGRDLIEFPCSSQESVLDCTLKEMLSLSKTLLSTDDGSFKGVNWLLFPEEDLDFELEYIETCPSDMEIKWYQSPNEKEGFYYCLNNKENILCFSASFYGGFIEEDSKFLKAVDEMETWDGLDCYTYENGYEYVDWESELYSMESTIFEFIFPEMNNIVNNLVVMQCSAKYSCFDDPLGPSYFVISGYNLEKGYCEGLIIEFNAT